MTNEEIFTKFMAGEWIAHDDIKHDKTFMKKLGEHEVMFSVKRQAYQLKTVWQKENPDSWLKNTIK